MNSRESDNALSGRARTGSGPKGQGGMTTLGFIILATFIGLFAFAAIRLTPVYLNYMRWPALSMAYSKSSMDRTHRARIFELLSFGAFRSRAFPT